jgi:hypothetical protein
VPVVPLPVIVQSIPGGDEVTRPVPVPPPLETVSVGRLTANDAVTPRAWSSVTAHAPVPEQSPLHPAKVEPPFAEAFSATETPSGKLALHAPVPAPAVTTQSMPAGVEVTRPAPVPAPETESVRCGTGATT